MGTLHVTDSVREWARTHPVVRTSLDMIMTSIRGASSLGTVLPASSPNSTESSDFPPPSNQEELVELVDRVIGQFKHFIEEQRGWSPLWKDQLRDKPEEAVQLAFLGMAQPFLRLFEVELDREVELGRGSVDFKISLGSRHRLLIEVKKAHTQREVLEWADCTAAELPAIR